MSLCVIIYLASKKEFTFNTWSLLGAADISIIGFFAFMAVTKLGYAKAPAMWAGTGMIVSFVWGSLFFKEKIYNVPFSVGAIFLLVVGVYLVSTVKSVDEEADPDCKPSPTTQQDQQKDGQIEKISAGGLYFKGDDEVRVHGGGGGPHLRLSDAYPGASPFCPLSTEGKEGSGTGAGEFFPTVVNPMTSIAHATASGVAEGASSVQAPTSPSAQISSATPPSTLWPSEAWAAAAVTMLAGYGCCLCTGFLDGSLMVPFKLSRATSLDASLTYLASFGLGSIAVTPPMFALYALGMGRRRDILLTHMRAAAFPGITSGVLWAQGTLANISQHSQHSPFTAFTALTCFPHIIASTHFPCQFVCHCSSEFLSLSCSRSLVLQAISCL